MKKKEEKKRTVQNKLGEEQIRYIFHAESAIKERQDRSRCQKPGVRNWGCEEAMAWLTSFAVLSYFFLYNHGPRHGTAHSGSGLPTSVVINRMLQGPETCPQASLPEVVTHQVSFPLSRCLLTVSSWQRQRSTVSI